MTRSEAELAANAALDASASAAAAASAANLVRHNVFSPSGVDHSSRRLLSAGALRDEPKTRARRCNAALQQRRRGALRRHRSARELDGAFRL
jgi:hypothetical protein